MESTGGASRPARFKRPSGGEWRHNLARNWFFAVSALFFYALNVEPSAAGLLSIAVAAMLAGVAAAWLSPIANRIGGMSKWTVAVAALGAVGSCAANMRVFRAHWAASSRLMALSDALRVPFDAMLFALSLAVAALALWYVFALLCALYRWLGDALRESGFTLTRAEGIALAVLFAALCAYMLWAFGRTIVLYGGDLAFDMVYTSDSPILVRENAYLCFDQLQNDIRQPLFAAFATPFVAPMYALSLALPFVPHADAILMNLPQLALLLFSCLLLAKLAKLSPAAELALMAAYCATYMTLLFTIMMEQYIVCVFWLTLTLWLCHGAPKRAMLPLMGAAGTMLPSAALAPVMCLRAEHSLPQRLSTLAKAAVCGLGSMLFFGRLSILCEAAGTVSYLTRFTGGGRPLLQRLWQYTAFVASCFVAPKAGRYTNTLGYFSWQQRPVEAASLPGVLLIALALLSLWLNRREWLARVCGYWASCSFVVLCAVGWGTAENGLVLYSLYFGWAYFLLIALLIRRALKAVKLERFTAIAYGLGACAMLWANIAPFRRMFRMLAEFYKP